MKKLRYFLTLSLLLAFAACSDSSEELLPQETQEEEINPIPVGTRVGEYTVSYYWFQNKKTPIYLHENSSFILFHETDKAIVLSRLAERGIKTENLSISDYGFYPYNFEDEREEVCKYTDVKKATIGINYQQALEIPEIIYACPCVTLPSGHMYNFPLTNLIYVMGGNTAKLESLAKEYNSDFLGKLNGFSNGYAVYALACTRDSKGNALEVANILFENGINAEPVFLSAQVAGGVE